MRLSLLVLTVFFTLALSGQNLLDKKISVSFNNQNVFKCVNKIESVSQIPFSYNANVLKSESKTITQSFTNESIKHILNQIFAQTQLRYKQIGNQITIYKANNHKQLVKLSGYIVNAQSQEKIIGARLFFKEVGQGCISNSYGYFQIDLPKGVYHYQVNSLGMITKIDSINLNTDLNINIELSENKIILKTIDVTDNKDTITTVNNDVSSLNKSEINPIQINQLTTSIGLPDVTKNIQQLPGVQPSFDGTSSYSVRGLSSSNNLILLDEIPIYHPNHLLGIYSIVNSNVVKSASFYKDYIPANFGTRNSSVLNIYTKEGDFNKYHLEMGLGANLPFVNIEGPIIKNKASFFMSARKSFNPLSDLKSPSYTKLPNPDFFDLTVKLNYNINYQNRIFFTTYIGNDKIDNYDIMYKWGNKATSFRWNRIINDKAFTKLTVVLNEFNFKTFNQLKSDSINQKVRTDLIKYNVMYYLSNSQKFNFGTSIIRTKTNDLQQKGLFLQRKAVETSVYGTYIHQINKKLSYEFGIRLPFNFQIGTNDSAYFLTSDLNYHPVYYKKNKLYNFKLSVDPRLLVNYKLNQKNQLQLSSIISTQFTHIVKYNSSVFPVEIWTTSNQYLKPERNFQTSVGLTHFEKYFKSSFTVFARHISNVIDIVTTDYNANKYGVESNWLSGNINVFGFELMTQFKKGKKYNGSFAYTYNYAFQKTEGINQNNYYTPQYFRPHYFSFNQYYILNNKWEFGSNFVLHSPTSINLPTGKTTIDGIEYPLYDNSKNTSFLPTYHRVDVSIKRTLGIKKNKNRGVLVLTFVNIYGRQNVSNAFYGVADDNPNKIEVKYQNYAPATLYLTYKIRL